MKKRFRSVLALRVLLVVGSALLFTYGLGWGSLEPWDEAWFADVGRNVARGDWLFLEGLGRPFIDHPPLGYWAMGVSRLIWGESTFAWRLPSAFFGVLAVLVLFELGRKIKSWQVGLAAVLVMISSRWYLLRVRSANLDSLLVLMQLLVVYWALVAKNKRQWWYGWMALGAAMMTKTVISGLLTPLLLWRGCRLWREKKIEIWEVVMGLGIGFGPILLWYGLMIFRYGWFRFGEMLRQVLFRGGGVGGYSVHELKESLVMWNALVHRWFKPAVISVVGSLVWIGNRRVRWGLAYLGLLAWPFFVSSQEKVWHLVMLVPAISLVIAVFGFELMKKLRLDSRLVKLAMVLGFGVVAGISLWETRREYLRADTRSDQEILGTAVRDLPGKMYIDVFEDVYSSVGYYADKKPNLLYAKLDKAGVDELGAPAVVYLEYDRPKLKSCVQVASSSGVLAYFCR